VCYLVQGGGVDGRICWRLWWIILKGCMQVLLQINKSPIGNPNNLVNR
jgi:hypothetical protein